MTTAYGWFQRPRNQTSGLDLSDLTYLILSDLLTVYTTPASGRLPLRDADKSRTPIKTMQG